MKKRKENFSYLESKNMDNNISENSLKSKENKSRFELLYENSAIHNLKLDLMRAKNYYNIHEKMIPVISKRAREINRPKELFHKRLYDSCSLIIDKKQKTHINTKDKNNKEKEKEKEKSNESLNSSFGISTEENGKNKNSKNDSDDNLYIINDKKRNEEHKKLYRYRNIDNNSALFLFRPIINDNSKLIASNMKTNTKERLMELSLTQKNNLKSILKRREMSNEKKLKEQNEKKLFKLNNNTYKPYVKDNKRKWVDRLYEKGINSIKQKEEIIRNQKIKLDNEYLKYSYSPLLNSNYTYTNFYKTKNSSKNSSITTNRNNTNTKSKNKDSLSEFKTSMYDRNKKWKDLIEKKKNKLKSELNDNLLNDSNNYFSPNINDDIMKTDISFIGKNIIEFESFMDKFNYKKYKNRIDKINYRKNNIPPKQIYPKKLVVEFVSECNSNLQINSDTNKLNYDKRPINKILKNREKLKISKFFENDVKLESDGNLLDENHNNKNLIKDKTKMSIKEQTNKKKRGNSSKCKNDGNNLSFFNAVNSIVNKIE
jgi:hypothetical protein